MQACIKTFGYCQMNARDSEKLRGILELIGYELTEQEEADFVLYNTYGTGKCESAGIWPTGLSERDQEKKSAYDDRTVRLYDAGAGGH